MPVRNRPTKAEFFQRVVVEDGCWVWQGSERGNGYGQVSRPDGSQTYAHIRSYEFSRRRSVPQGRVVMHTCDVRKCVNPKHLRLGTYSENSKDMVRKGRGALNRAGHNYVTAPARAALASKFKDDNWRSEFCRRVKEGRNK